MWQTIGHEWAARQLAAGINTGRVARACLITGPDGIGKMHLAREYGQALNCVAPDGVPCGECTHCRRIAALAHPDVSVFASDDGHIKIDQVRALQREIALRPFEARWRVAILADMHTATEEAENALLKTLEEPPEHAVIVLTALDAGLLRPTVVSRCQVFALRPVPAATISQALVSRGLADSGEADEIALLSGGRVGWALQAAQDRALVAAREEAAGELLNLLAQGPAGRVATADALSRQGEPEAALGDWQSVWRDVMLLAAGCPELVVHREHREGLERLAATVGLEGARRAVADTQQAAIQLKQNVNARLALEAMLLGWCDLRSKG